jgi:hypothetical protein
MPNGGPDVGIAMLGELGEGSGIKTPTGRMGGGAFEAPVMAGVGPNDLAADIGVNRVPRGYVNSKEAVGGNADGKADEDGDGNPYYKHGRDGGGSDGGGGYIPPNPPPPPPPPPYKGQKLSAW